jgi:hypothetical protein
LVWKDVSAVGPDNALGVQTITKQSATRWSYVAKRDEVELRVQGSEELGKDKLHEELRSRLVLS